MFVMEVTVMVVSFSTFTTVFFFLVSLIIIGVIFEKQFIALEDKFDAWIASKHKSGQKQRPAEVKRTAKAHKSAAVKDNKYRGFAA